MLTNSQLEILEFIAYCIYAEKKDVSDFNNCTESSFLISAYIHFSVYMYQPKDDTPRFLYENGYLVKKSDGTFDMSIKGWDILSKKINVRLKENRHGIRKIKWFIFNKRIYAFTVPNKQIAYRWWRHAFRRLCR